MKACHLFMFCHVFFLSACSHLLDPASACTKFREELYFDSAKKGNERGMVRKDRNEFKSRKKNKEKFQNIKGFSFP
jgi:hypothetical protein